MVEQTQSYISITRKWKKWMKKRVILGLFIKMRAKKKLFILKLNAVTVKNDLKAYRNIQIEKNVGKSAAANETLRRKKKEEEHRLSCWCEMKHSLCRYTAGNHIFISQDRKERRLKFKQTPRFLLSMISSTLKYIKIPEYSNS